MSDDLQIANTKSNMSDGLAHNQTISDLFDPFSPIAMTSPSSTTPNDQFDNRMTSSTNLNDFPWETSDTIDFSVPSSQKLINDKFVDDLWNGPMSHLTSSADPPDTDAFSWEEFLNPKQTENINPISTMKSDSLFDEDIPTDARDLTKYLNWLFDHFDQSQTTVDNLHQIIKDVHASLHSSYEPNENSLILNDSHHDLKLDPAPLLIKESFSFDDKVKPLVDELVSTTLKSALDELRQPSSHIEHFVDRVLADAIFEIYSEDCTPHSANIGPFNSVSTISITRSISNEKNDSIEQACLTNVSDDADLFSSQTNRYTEDDQPSTLSEYVPPSLLTNPANNPERVVNDAMKYTLTAPVYDDSADDSSMIEDHFLLQKKESTAETSADNSILTEHKPIQNELEENDPTDNIFTFNTGLSEFDIFASNEPLAISRDETSVTHVSAQFDRELSSSTNEQSPWTSLVQRSDPIKSSAKIENEPWELDESPEEKGPINQLTSSFSSPFDEKENRFADSFNPSIVEQENLKSAQILDDSSNGITEPVLIDGLTLKPAKSSELEEIQVEIDVSHPTNESNYIAKANSNDSSELQRMAIIETKVDDKQRTSTDTQIVRPLDSAILQPTSKNNDIINCIIDNTPISIDAKTIGPFRAVIRSAGQLHRDNQTAVIAIYGCCLPDHRLREYRYIMDQLFYYVYHELEQLVINDYVLVYFHGATPKHRTPDLKFLRKCYQMINFRLRKNLRAVYVVHPTRWLRTIIALSRPFFSKKFYHKINYLYTIAELQREFPHNHLTIPDTIEQTDWLYCEKYDRNHSSFRRSIGQNLGGFEGESAA